MALPDCGHKNIQKSDHHSVVASNPSISKVQASAKLRNLAVAQKGAPGR